MQEDLITERTRLNKEFARLLKEKIKQCSSDADASLANNAKEYDEKINAIERKHIAQIEHVKQTYTQKYNELLTLNTELNETIPILL